MPWGDSLFLVLVACDCSEEALRSAGPGWGGKPSGLVAQSWCIKQFLMR